MRLCIDTGPQKTSIQYIWDLKSIYSLEREPVRHAQTPIFEGVFDGIFADNENSRTYVNGISESLEGLGTTTFAEENENSETDTGDENEDEQQSTQTAGETTDSAPGISSATSSVDDSEAGQSNKKRITITSP